MPSWNEINLLSNQSLNLPSSTFFLSKCAKCAGKTRKHSIKLATKTAHTTQGIAAIISPITPLTINKGINAATVVNIADITGIDIRVAATTGACELFSRLLVFKYDECVDGIDGYN